MNRRSFPLLCFLLAAALFAMPETAGSVTVGKPPAAGSCLAPVLNAAALAETEFGTSADTPDIWSTRLLAIDYHGTIVSGHYPFSISAAIRAVDKLTPDMWAHPFRGTTTGELRRFIYTLSLFNYFYSINPDLTLMVVSTGMTPFRAVFESAAVNEFGAFPDLAEAYRKGRFVVSEGARNKTLKVRETAYRMHVPQKDIVALGDNPETDKGMALEAGRFFRMSTTRGLPPDMQTETPLTLFLQQMLFDGVAAPDLSLRIAA